MSELLEDKYIELKTWSKKRDFFQTNIAVQIILITYYSIPLLFHLLKEKLKIMACKDRGLSLQDMTELFLLKTL